MKDSEFIELLNLYLDHEITAGDAARLEAEVQSNPVRRRVYQDYCRMQKACKILAQDFASEENAEADHKVVAFEEARQASRRRSISLYVAGTLTAAAACVAVVFVARSREHSAPIPTDIAQTTPAAALQPTAQPHEAVVATAPAANSGHRGIERREINPLSLRNDGTTDLVLTSGAQNDPHFAWLQDVRLAPIQAPTPTDQVRFDVGPALKSENRSYTSAKSPLPSDVQWTAIRYQK